MSGLSSHILAGASAVIAAARGTTLGVAQGRHILSGVFGGDHVSVGVFDASAQRMVVFDGAALIALASNEAMEAQEQPDVPDPDAYPFGHVTNPPSRL